MVTPALAQQLIELGRHEGREPVGALDHEIGRLHIELRDVVDAGLADVEPVARELHRRSEHPAVRGRAQAIGPKRRVAVHDHGTRGPGAGAEPTGGGRYTHGVGGVAQVGERGEVTDHRPLKLHGEHCRVVGAHQCTEVEGHVSRRRRPDMSK